MTLDSGREEIERRMQRRKDTGDDTAELGSRRSSVDSMRSPTTAHSHGQQHHTRGSHALSDVAEDGTFAIGGDEDDEDDDDDDNDNDDDENNNNNNNNKNKNNNHDNQEEDSDDNGDVEPRPTPSQSSISNNPSRASSVVSVEDAVPTQLRGMSEKARGKMPAGAGPFRFSRQNSTTSLGGSSVHGGGDGHDGLGSGSSGSMGGAGGAGHGFGSGSGGGGGGIGGSGIGGGSYFEPTPQWMDSWLPELPLHTTLTLIQQISAIVPKHELAAEFPAAETLQRIREVHLVGLEASTIRVHSFEWSALALGWYESMLWSFVFSSEMQVAKGSVVGVWNNTAIRLFRVQETAAQGPSLTSPRGAVDAVGSNIVSRIGQIHLRGNNSAPAVAPGPVSGGGGSGGGSAAGATAAGSTAGGAPSA